MESVFWGFAGVMKTLTVEEMYIKGEVPVSFSLEIVGTEGKVQFCVRTQEAFKNLVESHFYAQYPDMEIMEIEDYAKNVPATIPNNEWDLWGCDFKFVRDDLYPIKTYKYFEESVTGKMIDPLAGMVETMAKLGPGEHIWYQLIITPHVESWSEEKGRATIKEFLHQVEKVRRGVVAGAFLGFWDIVINIPAGLLGK
ncbi:MAG: hypothetical protein Q7S00_07565, partial [bacterium]|nr:hypothetical protein [bacterium]